MKHAFLPALLALVACSQADRLPERATTVGTTALTVYDHGDRIEAFVEARRVDDALHIVFDKRGGARLIPKYGQSTSVTLREAAPRDVEEAVRFVSAPLALAAEHSESAKKAISPRVFNPPPPACVNPCVATCDERFPDPAQNAACRFGCNHGCGR